MKNPLPTLTMRLVLPTLVVTLAACGPDTDATGAGGSAHTDAYCSTLKNAGSQVLTHDLMSLDDASELADLRTNVSKLEGSAPVEVKADWDVLRDDFDGYTRVIDEAGISFDELLYVDNHGRLPASVDREQFAQLIRGLKRLDRSQVDQATDKIVAHASAECGIDVDPDRD